MNLKIAQLQNLKSALIELANDDDFLYRVEGQNSWFTKEFSQKAILNIVEGYLDDTKLKSWLSHYIIEKQKDTVGLILAGNIPIVGFNDILCAYFTTDNLRIKLSSKDAVLTPKILSLWTEIDSEWNERISIVERIENCDKIIATGSNNSYKYFEYYFRKYKHILRKNRTSIAIIHKNISDSELDALIDDIFLYFGLGCRNVSKLWIEKGFELTRIFEASERYNFLFNHAKYMNNYDYQRTLLLLNKVEHLSNNFLMLKEDENLFSPISVLHYQYFEDMKVVKNNIDMNKEQLQCVIGKGHIPFGQSQCPSLEDYADGIDTMSFLIS